MFANVLIANRGEIACRIIRTARRWACGRLRSHTPADRGALFTRLADEAHEIGEGGSWLSRRRGDRRAGEAASGAECLHPGYGFLSENAEFAEACARAGDRLRRAAAGGDAGDGAQEFRQGADAARPACRSCRAITATTRTRSSCARRPTRSAIPVLIKAIAGGGGRGMRRVDAHVDFEAALESASREAQAAFGDGRVLIEKYVASPRHIEVQVFADSHGNCVHLFERDCSLQRRHQKVIEERPAPGLPEATRAAMAAAAIDGGAGGRLCRARARSSSSPTPRAASARTTSISSR